MSDATADYIGRCKRCGCALWVSGTVLFGLSAGSTTYKCGRFKGHKK